jgi:hypothetical protein
MTRAASKPARRPSHGHSSQAEAAGKSAAGRLWRLCLCFCGGLLILTSLVLVATLFGSAREAGFVAALPPFVEWPDRTVNAGGHVCELGAVLPGNRQHLRVVIRPQTVAEYIRRKLTDHHIDDFNGAVLDPHGFPLIPFASDAKPDAEGTLWVTTSADATPAQNGQLVVLEARIPKGVHLAASHSYLEAAASLRDGRFPATSPEGLLAEACDRLGQHLSEPPPPREAALIAEDVWQVLLQEAYFDREDLLDFCGRIAQRLKAQPAGQPGDPWTRHQLVRILKTLSADPPTRVGLVSLKVLCSVPGASVVATEDGLDTGNGIALGPPGSPIWALAGQEVTLRVSAPGYDPQSLTLKATPDDLSPPPTVSLQPSPAKPSGDPVPPSVPATPAPEEPPRTPPEPADDMLRALQSLAAQPLTRAAIRRCLGGFVESARQELDGWLRAGARSVEPGLPDPNARQAILRDVILAGDFSLASDWRSNPESQPKGQTRYVYVLPDGDVELPMVWLGAPPTQSNQPERAAGIFIDQEEVPIAAFRRFWETRGTKGDRGVERWDQIAVEMSSDHASSVRSQHDGIAGFPASRVTIEDALDYARWTARRLPSEDEWRFAAYGNRAQPPEKDRLFPWGKDVEATGAIANLEKADPWNGIVPNRETRRDVSWFGCLAMGGNLQEWVTLRDGQQPALMGGHFRSGRDRASSQQRTVAWDRSDTDLPTVGFRCVLELPRDWWKGAAPQNRKDQP